MLAALFLAALVASVVATVAVFVRPPSLRPGAATPRAAAALLSLLPLSAGPLAVALLGGDSRSVLGAAAALVVADVAWLKVTRRWSWRGHAAWTATTSLTLAYLAYMLTASLAPGRGAVATAGGLLLWLVELAVFALAFAYLWEVLDVTARREWPRRLPEGLVGEPVGLPFVSLHVPAHNEPPDMVLDTLRSLVALDYPHFEVVMVDDNTVDPELWHPLRDWCEAYDGPVPVRFVHLEDWPGFKSGALNYVLQHATDPRAEVIGVVDADYVVDSDYLRKCAPLFAERPRLAFVQTPQNYREWEHAPYLRRLFYSYEYFFRVSQVSRNELDGAIFGGTMGLIRRSALEEVGGWDEWCITEDAEVSLKMLRAGWSGQHVERPFGHGVMPLTFEALKRQRFRWCFGGVQILKAHWRSLMPWDRSPDNHLTQAQRWCYLSGGVQWFADVLALAFAAILASAGLALALGNGLVLRRFTGVLLVLPPLLLGMVVLRAVAVLRLRTGASLRDGLGALLLWLALGWTVALACVRGLVQPEGVFLRTPKTREEPSLRDALGANRFESLAGALLVVLGVAVLLREVSLPSVALVSMLTWHAVGFLGAPLSSVAAMRADLPPALRRRRATEWLRERNAVRGLPARVGTGAVLVIGMGLVAFAFLTPLVSVGGRPADVLGELRGQPPVEGRLFGPVPAAPVGPAPPSPAPAERPRATPSVSSAPTPPVAASSAAPAPAPGATAASPAAPADQAPAPVASRPAQSPPAQQPSPAAARPSPPAQQPSPAAARPSPSPRPTPVTGRPSPR